MLSYVLKIEKYAEVAYLTWKCVSFCDVQEEEKYEAVEKEYETVAELAKEDELELRCVVII
jgi:uncharacterized protein YuzB (UPF0349 family)